MMRDDIIGVSQLLKGKTEIFSSDYSHILESATTDDLIYMDPPYQGTGQNGGFNYAGNIDFDDFLISLYGLNQRNIPYILSYDGRTGNKTFGKPLPDALNLTKVEINAGRSTQATLLNREEYTYEAVYLSSVLIKRIDKQNVERNQHHQQELFACYE
jgi:DNA adenine methylase